MKIIKPQRLGFLYRVFEHHNECYFVVSILVFFPFEAAPSPGVPRAPLLPEQKLWPFVAQELGKDAALDQWMPKPRAELLITGRGYALAGKPRTACSVRARLGSIDKTLYVVGNRVWEQGGASDPEPFTEIPITYENAFGGPSHKQNPVGKGIAKVKGDKGDFVPLPNIEDPRRLLRSPGERPAPAGFGPYDLIWPQRYSKVGTYDAKWLKERFPGLADDADLGLFNAAPEDQQLSGYLVGDEPFSLENMHPDKPLLEAALPGLRARCFITQKTAGGDVLREITTRLDTVHLFPHAERGVLIYRGLAPIAEDDAADVLHALVAAEDLGSPRPAEHYREVLAQRLDKKKGAWLALRDGDLMPVRPPSGAPLPDEVGSDMHELLATEGLVQRHMRRRTELVLEDAREQVKALGLDPAEHVPVLPPPEPLPDPENFADTVKQTEDFIADAKAQIEAKKVEAERDARSACKLAGLDYEKVMLDARKGSGGPPKFSAKEELAKLRGLRDQAAAEGLLQPEAEAALSDPELEAKLATAEAQLFDAYRKFAHHFPAASSLEGDESSRVRAQVIADHRAGLSFAERDLTGADLSKLDLSGADFKGALLECVDFSGANLSGTVFEGAVLARANLTGTNLKGAKLKGANLGRAVLHGTLVSGGVDLSSAVLSYADFAGADFSGAQLTRADLFGATFAATDFSRVTAPQVSFVQSNLTGLKLVSADLTQCNFVEVDVSGVDFSGAKLTSAVFVTARGDKAVFRNAKLDNLRVVKDSQFPGADFIGAMMTFANLRGTNLAGADFSGAALDGADLSECDLSNARLYRVTAKKALLMRTNLTDAFLVSINLMESILQKAVLRGADFRGANLFRADLAKVDLDRATNFDEANLKFVRVVNRRAHDKG